MHAVTIRVTEEVAHEVTVHDIDDPTDMRELEDAYCQLADNDAPAVNERSVLSVDNHGPAGRAEIAGHEHAPSDTPSTRYGCKYCGADIVWVGPGVNDWQAVSTA